MKKRIYYINNVDPNRVLKNERMNLKIADVFNYFSNIIEPASNRKSADYIASSEKVFFHYVFYEHRKVCLSIEETKFFLNCILSEDKASSFLAYSFVKKFSFDIVKTGNIIDLKNKATILYRYTYPELYTYFQILLLFTYN